MFFVWNIDNLISNNKKLPIQAYSIENNQYIQYIPVVMVFSTCNNVKFMLEVKFEMRYTKLVDTGGWTKIQTKRSDYG